MAEPSKITAVLTDNGIVCKDAKGATVTAGGSGPKASELVLMAVAGCSASTLKAIMAKEGWNLLALDITVEGVASEERPRHWTDVQVHYDIQCPGLPDEKAEAYVKATGDNCFVMQSISAKKHLTFTVRR